MRDFCRQDLIYEAHCDISLHVLWKGDFQEVDKLHRNRERKRGVGQKGTSKSILCKAANGLGITKRKGAEIYKAF